MSSLARSPKIGALGPVPVNPNTNSSATLRSSGSLCARSVRLRGTAGPVVRSAGVGITRSRNDRCDTGPPPADPLAGGRNGVAQPPPDRSASAPATATAAMATSTSTRIRRRRRKARKLSFSDVRADRIKKALDENKVVLVAGFQGVSTAADVTTLGRGGSDTTAVALAAALGADVCEIYTDVSGVYSADPRLVPGARKLRVVSFEEMLEMSASGARVLQLRSVEYARNHGVRIHCRSSFLDEPGTFVVPEEETMEQPPVTAVTHSTDEARVTLTGLPDRPGVAGRVLTAMAEAGVNVDTLIPNEPEAAGH